MNDGSVNDGFPSFPRRSVRRAENTAVGAVSIDMLPPRARCRRQG